MNARARRRVLTLSVIFLLILLLGFVLVFYFTSLRAPSSSDSKVELTIYEGESTAEVLDDLEQKDLIRSSLTARIYSVLNDEQVLYAGTFEVPQDLSVKEVFEFINDPENIRQEYERVTIPEGTWAKEIAVTLSEHFPAFSAQDFLNLWNDESYIQELSQIYPFIHPDEISPDSFVKLEGYLFPDTYFFDLDMNPRQITGMFLDEFNNVYQQLQTQIQKSPLDIEEIVTLASIVQFESGDENSMADIAQVFYNRMNTGMRLESSVTVCYALYDEFDDFKDCETNPTIDSPYNTYMNAGLPAGPILNPGKEAIEAVLNPHDNDYLFFVSDIYGDGTVYYAETYEEHLENIEKYNLNMGSEATQ